MNSKFNLVKKPKKTDDDELMDEYELEESESKSNSFSDNNSRKNMFIFMGIVVGIMVVVILVLSLLSSSKKTYTYGQIEKILKDAAISYFKDYPESLPQDENSIVEIDSSNLVAAEKMKDLSEYTKEGDVCTGTVQVEKAGNQYLYTPYLNCGNNYITVELYKKVIENEQTVTSGYGLYAVNGNYVYRGELVNNYVKFGKTLWRIVKITSNNNIVLINEDGVSYSQPWDNRYNEEKLYSAGINQYSASRVKEFLEKIYNNPNSKLEEDIISGKEKAKMISFNVCTGKRSVNSESKDNSLECQEVLRDQRMGLLTLSDYMYASIDPKCVNASNKNCMNYNYLAKKYDWWLVTANKDDSASVFSVNRNGIVKAVDASNYAIVRPVVYLSNQVLYKSGNGTLEKPYKIK